MGILGLPPLMSQDDQYVAVFTNRISKLTRSVPTSKLNATHIANLLVDSWKVLYGIPTNLLVDYDPQFVSKFSARVRGYLAVRHLTPTALHPHANGQTNRSNRMMMWRLRHYGSDHQHH